MILEPGANRHTPKSKKQHPRLSYERRIWLMALMTGVPGSLVAIVMLWMGDYMAKTQWTLTVFIVSIWLGFAYAVRNKVVFPLQTLSNLLAALREGDYSLRARGANPYDALGEIMIEVNALGETLREQRLGAMEATALLRTVMSEIDVAVFAFDGAQRLRLINRAGERLLAKSADHALGRSAVELGLRECLDSDTDATLPMAFPGGTGRWAVRRSTIWERGLPHQLLVLTDLSRALREQERQAWQRIIRVIGHELNNSLAPIKSISGSLERLLTREPRPNDWQDDMQRGLTVITARAEALSRFMTAYSQLARLPRPQPTPFEVGTWIRRAAGLETRLPVAIVAGPPVTIQADADQLEQLLINLIRNATDAALETLGGVRVGWSQTAAQLEVWVEDDGPGLSNTANLFVPFFTTKPGGTGIGLVLCRQIAEAHDGSLTLENRPDGRGCVARLRLPL